MCKNRAELIEKAVSQTIGILDMAYQMKVPIDLNTVSTLFLRLIKFMACIWIVQVQYEEVSLSDDWTKDNEWVLVEEDDYEETTGYSVLWVLRKWSITRYQVWNDLEEDDKDEL